MLDDTWTHGGDDASITTSIKEGRLAQGMPAWKRGAVRSGHPRDGHLHPRERRQSEARKDHVRQARRGDERSERETRLQAADRRRRREVALVDLVPSRRAHARHRKDRPAPHRRKGPARGDAGRRRAGGVVEGSGRIARRRRASGLREERLDLSLLQRSRRGRQRDDGDRPRQAPRRTARRSGDALQGARGAVSHRQRPLRIALRLRRQGPRLLLDRRTRPRRRRAGSVASERQGPPHQRRRQHPEGQSVRRQGQRAADDLELRQPQSAGPRAASRRRAISGKSSTARAAATS